MPPGLAVHRRSRAANGLCRCARLAHPDITRAPMERALFPQRLVEHLGRDGVASRRSTWRNGPQSGVIALGGRAISARNLPDKPFERRPTAPGAQAIAHYFLVIRPISADFRLRATPDFCFKTAIRRRPDRRAPLVPGRVLSMKRRQFIQTA